MNKIAFTGSTEVGRAIRKATAPSHKRLSLELGGKSPFIIFEDADLDSAVEGLVDGIWLNQGQVCCAGSRLLMQESIAEPLLEKVRLRMSSLRVGPPLDKAIDVGAIVARVQLERIQRLVEQGVAEGATCWQPPGLVMPSRGLYFPPTLLSNVHPASIVAQQEIFGPVLAAMTFRTPREAVELANNTVYGLAASVWSESINVALHVAAQVKAGVVWVNSTNLFDAACGFGGYRESGYGREGGREGMLEYLEPIWFGHAPKLQSAPVAIDLPIEESEEEGSGAGYRSHGETLHWGKAGTAGFRLQHGSARRGWTFARRVSAGQSKGHPECGGGSAQGGSLGKELRRITARKSCTTSPRTCHSEARRSRGGWLQWSGRNKLRMRCATESSGCFPMRLGRTSSTARCTIRRSGMLRWR